MSETQTVATLRHLVAALTGPDPLPAGGAAGVAAIAMGAALGVKVLRLGADGDPEPEATELEQMAAPLQAAFTEDCEAFAALLQARRLPRDDPSRDEAVQAGWQRATAAPIGVVQLGERAEACLERRSGAVRKALHGDLTAALRLIRAGLEIARSNAAENGQHLEPGDAQALWRTT